MNITRTLTTIATGAIIYAAAHTLAQDPSTQPAPTTLEQIAHTVVKSTDHAFSKKFYNLQGGRFGVPTQTELPGKDTYEIMFQLKPTEGPTYTLNANGKVSQIEFESDSYMILRKVFQKEDEPKTSTTLKMKEGTVAKPLETPDSNIWTLTQNDFNWGLKVLQVNMPDNEGNPRNYSFITPFVPESKKEAGTSDVYYIPTDGAEITFLSTGELQLQGNFYRGQIISRDENQARIDLEKTAIDETNKAKKEKEDKDLLKELTAPVEVQAIN